MNTWENKLVLVMNKNIEPGVIMNAAAHICLASGAQLGQESLHLVDYVSKDKVVFPHISKMPFIILQANSNKIKSLLEQAQQHNLTHTVFTNTMTGGTWQEQIEKTANLDANEIEYYGIFLAGPFDLVKQLTGKFSLWR